MDLEELRVKIDAVDTELIRLFADRMDVALEIARYKQANGLPVLDARREEAKLRSVAEKCRPELEEYTKALFTLLMELSRCHQNRALGNQPEFPDKNITEVL